MQSTPLYTTADLREVERMAGLAIARQGGLPLMERAGHAAAEHAREMLGDLGSRVLVLAGPGNNGGDALVAARWLREWFYQVDVVLDADPARLPADAALALQAWQDCGGGLLADLPASARWHLVIDGLFGIGLRRALGGIHQARVEAIAALPVPVLALDLPSGLDADTGTLHGCAMAATRTLSFIALKPGLFTADGPDHCGEVRLATLDVDAPSLVRPSGGLLDAASLGSLLPPRRRNSHKGSYGSVGVLGGAPGMVGAALLAARAALRVGAGRVTVGLIDESGPAFDPAQPELMLRPWHDMPRIDALTVLAAGPGLGDLPESRAALVWAIGTVLPLVLDADALNLVAADRGLREALVARQAATVLTPHPAEAARLLGTDTRSVQADRVASACHLAREFDCAVVLKGAGSVSALAGGTWFIHGTGNPGMASAGMGDVLTGMVAGLLAQGLPCNDALTGAVTLHGAAGDAVALDHGSPRGLAGLTASDVAHRARDLLAGA